MKLKLNSYNLTSTFTSRDIQDAATDPPLVYEVHTNRPDGFSEAIRDFYTRKDDQLESGLKIIGLAVISVSVHGVEDSRQEIGSTDKARELMAAIEEISPGQGESFIIHLARGIWSQQCDREELRLKNSGTPLEQSANGNGTKPEHSKTAQKSK